MRKLKRGLIVASVFVVCTLLVIILLSVWNKHDFYLVKGVITDKFEDSQYTNGRFLIDGIYSDSSETLNSIKEKYGCNIRIGDSVIVVCKKSPIEIAPIGIDIYFIVEY